MFLVFQKWFNLISKGSTRAPAGCFWVTLWSRGIRIWKTPGEVEPPVGKQSPMVLFLEFLAYKSLNNARGRAPFTHHLWPREKNFPFRW